MYILIGVIILAVVVVFVKYGTMDYVRNNWMEWGRNKDIREADQKK